MDVSPGLRIAQRYWLAILFIAVLAAGMAFVASYVVSPSYSATTRVLVRADETHFLSATGQDLTQQVGVVDSTLTQSLTQTASDMVKSRAVAEQMVQQLKLDQPRPEDASFLGQARSLLRRGYRVMLAYLQFGFYAEPPAYEGAITQAQNSLDATPIKNSYLVEIRAHADDPELTAAMANVATDAFMRESALRFQSDAARYREFLKGETDKAMAQLSNAEQAVRAYQEEKGISDIAEQLKLSADSQDSARSALDAVNADLANAQARAATLQQQLDTLDATERSTSSVHSRSSTDSPQTTSVTATQETSPSTTVQEASPNTTTQVTSPSTNVQDTPATTSVSEAGRGKTTSRTDPVSSTTTLGGTRSTTTSEGTRVSSSVDGATTSTRTDTTTTQSSTAESTQDQSSVAPNRVYQSVQDAAISAQTDSAGLEAKRMSLAQALDDRTNAAASLPEAQARLAELQVQLSAATNTYASLHTAYENAVINDARGTQEVSLVDSATAPIYPDRPLRYLFALIGLLCGLIGGTGIAWFIDRTGGLRAAEPAEHPRAVPGQAAVPVLTSHMLDWT